MTCTLCRVAAAAAAGAVAVLAVGQDTRATGAAVPAPQGTLVFASDRTGTSQIYSIRADETQLGQLTHGNAGATTPLFSPDGRRIVFFRSSKQYVHDLWVMNADGSGQHRLAASGSAPAWSHDSRRVAYIASSRNGSSSPLAITDLAGGRTVLVRGRNGTPAWSPDDTLIAFSHVVGETYCCDRTNLMVVGPDGRGLRTVRREATAIGWSPHGEIAFSGRYGKGVGLVGRDGRGARRILRFRPNVLAWSPDGRRLAFVGGPFPRDGLHVSSADGTAVRDLQPQNVNFADSPVWSPDSRWLAISYAPNGTVVRDVLLVAAEGSATKSLTTLAPPPWGTGYAQPSWRPRGATPARLGGAPAAPLPTENVTPTTFAPGAKIIDLAADAGLAAVVVTSPPRICEGVESWEPARKRFVRLVIDSPDGSECLHGQTWPEPPLATLAVARRNVARAGAGGGNTLETTIQLLRPDRAGGIFVADEGALENGTGDVATDPLGHAGVMVFSVQHRCDTDPSSDPKERCADLTSRPVVTATTIYRLGGHGPCPRGDRAVRCAVVAKVPSKLQLLAVDSHRVVVRTSDGVRLLGLTGKVLRDLPIDASAAALSGTRLALRTAGAIQLYDTRTGGLQSRFPVGRDVRLQGLEGDMLVTTSSATVKLRSLANGRRVTLRTDGPALAKLTDAGLFLAGSHIVRFLPRRQVAALVGG